MHLLFASKLFTSGRRQFALYVFVTILLTTKLFAQVEQGIITGIVHDASGAVVANATVTLHNANSGISTVTSTDKNGLYVSPPLNPGAYDLKFEAPTFKAVVQHVNLAVADRVNVNASLSVGLATETVEVQADALQLNTESSSVSGVQNEEAVHDLPLNGRNFAELLGLSAGVVPGAPQAQTVTISESRQQADFSANGLRSTDNRFLFDGIGDNQNHSGNGAIIFPPVDALEEFREETTDADARYGRATGGTINVIYKSGTNQYHGEIFDFFRNSALDARNYFDTIYPKPGFRMNDFGGTFGGPLFHTTNPKTFFFADYAGQRELQGITNIDTVPDWGPLGVGDFSLYAQAAGKATIVKNPLTGNPFPINNYIAPSDLANLQTQFGSTGFNSQVGLNVLNLYSKYGITPNLPGTANGTASNFYFAGSRIDNSNAFDVKVDHQFSNVDNGFLRYSQEVDNIVQPGILPNPLEGASTFGFEHEPAYQAVLSETHTFSPTLLNTFRFGWSRLFITTKNFDAGQHFPTQLGIPGIIVPGDEFHTDGLPIFTISGGQTAIGDPSNVPDQLGTNNYQESDDVSLVRGKHSLDFGAEVLRLQYDVYMATNEHGNFTFSGNYTGLGLADLLLGAPTSGSYAYQAGARGGRQFGLGFYAQDNYKVNSRLTLNLGVRYDNYLGWPWTEVNNKMYNFIPSLSTTRVFQVGTNGVPRSGVKGNNLNFAPRVGFAYKVDSKTVFHAGYGIYYGAPSLIDTSTLLQNAPAIDYWAFTNPTAYNSTGANFTWLSNGFVHTPPTDPANLAIGTPLNAIDPNAKDQYSEQWHASIEQEIGPATRITVAYVGNVGVHLIGAFDINQATPGPSGPTAPSVASRRPYPNFNAIKQLRTSLVSNYNALQVTAERRTKDLTFQVSYTYSHNLDENSSSTGALVNAYNQHADYGNSDYDIPSRFIGSVIYRLPFQGSGWLRPVVRGWQLNAILNYSDGLPFSVLTGSNGLNIADSIVPRAQLVAGNGNGSLPSNKRGITVANPWFNTAAFKNPGTQNWSDYNSGRNTLQGPGTKNVDFSVFRNIKLTERFSGQLRSEFFNLFNTPQFNNPNATTGSASFGTITSAGSPLTLQRISREIQLAVKITF